MKNLTVLLKSLILTVTLASITACSTSSPYQSQSISRPAMINSDTSASAAVYAVESAFITMRYGLDDVQKQKQSAAVHAALNSEYGEIFHWYERDAKGSVKAVHGYPMGSGFCRVLYSQITVKGRSRHFEETACTKVGLSGWRFLTKHR